MSLNLKDLQKRNIEDLKPNRPLKAEEVVKLQEVVEKTGMDEKPFPAPDTSGNITVIGDANQIKREPQAYSVVVTVDKETSKYTREDLEAINALDELVETPTEYRLVVDVPVNKITPDNRDIYLAGVQMTMMLFYREVEHEDGTTSTHYISDLFERQARMMELIGNAYVSKVVRDSATKILDLPEGLQLSTSQALEVFVDFAEKNGDLLNEVDANLK